MPATELTIPELFAARERRLRSQSFAEQATELEQSLPLFVKAAWPVVEPSVQYRHNWHIDAIVAHLEAVTAGEIRKLQVWVPPGSMKSRAASIFWPAWEWIRNPGLRYWSGSYDLRLSQRLTSKTRDLIMSAWFQARWGERFRMTKTDERYYANDRGGNRLATSPTAGGTGEHGHRILIDDPLDPERTESFQAPVLEQTNAWYDGTVATRGIGDTAEVIIMQRIHQADLAGHALEHGGWTVLCLPELFEPAHPYAWRGPHLDERVVERLPNDLREGDPRDDGELLWPDLFGAEKHAERQRMGAHRAAGRLQQRPAAREGETLKRTHWRFYPPQGRDEDDAVFVARLPAFQAIWQSWDTSFKDTTGSDKVAGTVWGQIGADLYLLPEARHERMNLSAAKRAIRELSAYVEESWPALPHRILVENTANGPEIIAELQREIRGVIATKPSVGADKPASKKIVRAEAASPALEAGNIYLPGYPAPHLPEGYTANTPEISQELVEQCAAFPNAPHDDLVDSFTQAVNWTRAAKPVRSSLSRPGSRRTVSPGSLQPLGNLSRLR